MAVLLSNLIAQDIRFPTSKTLDGSDAMNPDPDYSAAYVVLETDTAGLEGHGLTFNIGRGNELCVAAVKAMRSLVVGQDSDEIVRDMAGFRRRITGGSPTALGGTQQRRHSFGDCGGR